MKNKKDLEKSVIMGDCNNSVTSLLLQCMGDEISTALNRILSELANAVKIYKKENTELKQIITEANKEVLALRFKQKEHSKRYFVLLDNFSNHEKVITELKTENLALKGHVKILEARKNPMTMGIGDHIHDGDQNLEDFGAKNKNEIFKYFGKNKLCDTFEPKEKCDKMTDIKESYNCKYCGKSFSSQSEFDLHHKKMHVESLICPKCNKQYSSKSNLYLHNQSQHKGMIFKCNFCVYNGKQKSALNIHMKKNHTLEGLQGMQNCHVPVPLRTTAAVRS